MKGTQVRLWGWGALICLPAVLLCLLGGYFLVKEVPSIERRQKARQTRECRREAERLSENAVDASYRAPSRPKGWRQAGKLKSGLRWGYVDAEASELPRKGDRLVWVESAEGVLCGSWITFDDERQLGKILVIAVPAVLLIVLLLTLVGLRFFVLYARGRDDFLAAAAHDLRTPLVGLRMTIGRDDDEARCLVERMLRIVANVNDFLKLGGKRSAPACERLDLVACYHEAYAIFREDFRELNDGRDLALSIEGDGEHCFACGDPTHTVQILWNLLGNELKYAAPYGPVAVRFFQSNGRSVVEIADGGPGLSAIQRRRVFSRYYRAKSALKSGKGGFGIGLCSSRDSARAMGGDLTLRANSPKGCVFTLSLPGDSISK